MSDGGNELTPFAIGSDDEDDLSDFAPKRKPDSPKRPSNDDEGAFPSREASTVVKDADHWENLVQLNLRVAEHLKTRFKATAKSRGAKFNAMLGLAMDAFDTLEPSEHRLKRMAEARGIAPEDLVRKALDAYEAQE